MPDNMFASLMASLRPARFLNQFRADLCVRQGMSNGCVPLRRRTGFSAASDIYSLHIAVIVRPPSYSSSMNATSISRTTKTRFTAGSSDARDRQSSRASLHRTRLIEHLRRATGVINTLLSLFTQLFKIPAMSPLALPPVL